MNPLLGQVQTLYFIKADSNSFRLAEQIQTSIFISAKLNLKAKKSAFRKTILLTNKLRRWFGSWKVWRLNQRQSTAVTPSREERPSRFKLIQMPYFT